MTDKQNTTPEETQARVVTKRIQRKGRKAVEKSFQTLEALAVTYVPLPELRQNDWNPNRQSDHDFELLLRSMEEDGFTQPVLALKEKINGQHIIIDGEHRWRAAAVLGFDDIPVVMVDMTPEQARISTIRHNRARGSHDIQLEAELLRDLQRLGAIEWAQDSLMLDDVELNRLLSDISVPDALSDEDYSEAWVPDTFSDEEAQLVKDGIKTTEIESRTDEQGSEMASAMTSEAIVQLRRREELIEMAKTEEERRMARQESKVYRISLIFGGDEAVLVKKVLGNRPAEALVKLCQHEHGGRDELES